MRSLRGIFSISAQNFRKWQTDYRVWCIAILITIMTAIWVDDLKRAGNVINERIPVWIFPFLYSQFHTKLIFFLPVVLLFCNAPFTDRNQTFVFTRSGRVKWLCGQVLYITLASAFYFLYLLTVSILLTVINGGDPSSEWGGLLATLSHDGYLRFEANAPFLQISPAILAFFKPWNAVGFTFLMSWLGGTFIGLLIFFLNIISGTKIVGVLAASFLVVMSSAVENDLWDAAMPYSPVSWTTLDNIDVGGLTRNPSFAYCVTVYAALIVFLIAAILIFGRKKSLDTFK